VKHAFTALVALSLAGAPVFAAPPPTRATPALAALQDAAPPASTAATDAARVDFAGAVALYERGDYADAAAAFGQLAAHEPDARRRAELHANAGTAAARAEDFGLALWHLESAGVGTPRDASVQRNLTMVRAWLGEGDVSPDRLPAGWSDSVLLLSARERQLVAAGLFTLALLLLALRRRGRLGRGTTVTAVGCALLGVALLGAARHALDERATHAILLADASVRGEPDVAAESLFRLAEGAEVRVLESRGEHRLIVTADDDKGWVRAELARTLDLGAG